MEQLKKIDLHYNSAEIDKLVVVNPTGVKASRIVQPVHGGDRNPILPKR